MKPIEKKKPAGRIPSWARIAAAVLFLISAALFCRVLLRDRTETAPAPITGAEKETLLFQTALEDIASVTITPPDGNAYTLAVSDGRLTLAGDPAFPIKDVILKLISDNICNVRSERTIARFSAEDRDFLSRFGLDPPVCSAEILMLDGSASRIRIGSQIRGDEIPYYYFLWNEDPLVYAGGTDMYSAFSYGKDQLHTVEAVTVNIQLLDRFSVSGENCIAFQYTDTGWYCVSPYRYPMDQNKMAGYLQNVKNLQFSGYVCPADETALEACGLLNPSMTFTFTEAESTLTVPDTTGKMYSYTVPGRTGVIRFGDPCDEYNRYAEYNGSIYTATDFSTGFLAAVSPEDLAAVSPFCVEIYQLSSLTMTKNGTGITYTLELTEQFGKGGDLVTDADGNILYSLSVYKDGALVENAPFLYWYNNTLRALIPSGKITGAAEGEAEAVLTLRGGNDERTISFIPMDPIHYAMSVDGTALYYVSRDLFAAITDAP